MAIKTNQNKRTTFPALRCHMGDWVYYVTYMKFSDVSIWVKQTEEIHKNKKLKDMIQREIGDRVGPIVDYLLEQKERFFNSIVVGVYGGAPKWYPINVGDSPAHGSPDLDGDARNAIGLLMLEGEEKLFAIDGQHRVVAISKALKENRSLADEQLGAIFVAHSNDEKGMMRTRRLFSTLNRYAVPVSKGEIVALSEDDAFAIVTRRLVEDFPLLKSDVVAKEGFVFFGKTSNVGPSDRKSLTSVLTLYDIVTTIHIPRLDRRERKDLQRLKDRRPTDQKLNAIYHSQITYWNLLKANIPEYKELFASKPEEQVAGKYRGTKGGHLMFRPIGQKAFASAVRIMMDRGLSMKKAVAALSKVPMDLNEAPWKYVLWNPSTKKVNSKVSNLLPESLFLHYVRQQPRRPDFNLLDEYRKVLDNPTATL
ncbi:MAG TPA: DNA sulfur modification protein DndB [Pyrinomonadaceae bacterium]|nr:DNA sulfur modification protein DndB [Pyrinomonadaceae bacterium]